MNTGCGGQGCGNSFGNWLFLKHTLTDGSTLFSFYAHMAEMTPAVVEGACIKTGQKVGVIGNTGIASAAHLHFAIQTNTNLLDYTSASSATVGSVDPDSLYGKVKVKAC
jgi:murein DD-endopeptidase MepM/ murein hydrolase activator NlpD